MLLLRFIYNFKKYFLLVFFFYIILNIDNETINLMMNTPSEKYNFESIRRADEMSKSFHKRAQYYNKYQHTHTNIYII